MQYLVNWRLFFSDECKNFPAEICFPQYFYLCIISIIYQYIGKKYIFLKVIKIFYNDLQSIVDSIFHNDKKITLKSPKEIETLIENFENNSDIFYLETFIQDEESKLNYQEGLLRQSLEFYKKDSLGEIIDYLCANDCCSVEDGSGSVLPRDSPPHSRHYVTLGTNCTLKRYFLNNTFGPNIWGPFYWIIFHKLPTVCTNNKVINNYPKILPALIPCEFCRRNYYVYIRPSSLPDITSSDDAVIAYSNIHNQVTKHKTLK